MKAYALAELVLDYDLYPRKEIDKHHASVIEEAIANGAELPPLVICRKTKRIADGFHRYRAYKRLSGDDPTFKVQCIEKSYKSDADLFMDAMRYNATHGRALTKFDRTYCMLVAKQLNVADSDIAKILHVEPQAVKQLLAARCATTGNGKQKLTPIKATIKHKAGKPLTTEQVACNTKLGGMQQTFYANQLIMLIENDLLDVENETLMERLGKLRELLLALEVGV